jgi:F-type H+-transporting ATPase subunit gamma
MEALPRMKARLSSLHDLRDIIRALRAMAATHVQEAQGALPGIRRYVEVVEDAIAEGAALLPDIDMPLSMGPLQGRAALVVLCSEHGFVGGFSERLLDRAAAERTTGQDLIVVGTRGIATATERGYDMAAHFAMATHVGGVLDVTRRIAAHLADAGTARVVFERRRRGALAEIEVRTILPLDPSLMIGSKQRHPPLHQVAPEVLLESLAEEYLFAEITGAVMESLASENAARLRAMEAADQNIGDRLDKLSTKAHALRQEAITSELLDVVTGAEAMLGADA